MVDMFQELQQELGDLLVVVEVVVILLPLNLMVVHMDQVEEYLEDHIMVEELVQLIHHQILRQIPMVNLAPVAVEVVEIIVQVNEVLMVVPVSSLSLTLHKYLKNRNGIYKG